MKDETSDDESVYFTDGHVISNKLVVIAAKLNSLSDEDFSRVLDLRDGEWTYKDIQDSVHSVWYASGDRSVYWLGRNGLITVGGGGRFRSERISDANEYGFLNRIRGIGSAMYICGYAGQVYRKAGKNWEHFDTGILDTSPSAASIDLQDIDGNGPGDIYTVGTGGAIFHFNGKKWESIDSPTNLHLLRLKCVSKEEVYICGARGRFYRGHGNQWEDLSDPDFNEDFWGIEYYREKVYLAHSDGLMVWTGKALRPVNVGAKRNISAHRLHANDGVLWSFGMDDLFRFDGTRWTEIHCPLNPQ